MLNPEVILHEREWSDVRGFKHATLIFQFKAWLATWEGDKVMLHQEIDKDY